MSIYFNLDFKLFSLEFGKVKRSDIKKFNVCT